MEGGTNVAAGGPSGALGLLGQGPRDLIQSPRDGQGGLQLLSRTPSFPRISSICLCVLVLACWGGVLALEDFVKALQVLEPQPQTGSAMCPLLLRPPPLNPTCQGWTGETASQLWAQGHNKVGVVGPAGLAGISAVLSQCAVLEGDHSLQEGLMVLRLEVGQGGINEQNALI